MDIVHYMYYMILDKSVLCSNEKNKGYHYLIKDEAFNKNFVRFGNKFFVPTVSVDIDVPMSIREIYRRCRE